jgi:hypothetical protein
MGERIDRFRVAVKDYTVDTLAVAAIGFVSIGLTSAAVDGIDGDGNDERVFVLQSTYDDKRTAQVDADNEQATFEDRFGAACIAAVDPYLYGQGLAYVDEEDAKNDILNKPEQPCGNDPTQVRTAVHAMRWAAGTEALVTADGYDFDTKRQELEVLKNEQRQDNDFKGGTLGALLGAVLGAAYGAQNMFSKRRAEKRQIDEYERLKNDPAKHYRDSNSYWNNPNYVVRVTTRVFRGGYKGYTPSTRRGYLSRNHQGWFHKSVEREFKV